MGDGDAKEMIARSPVNTKPMKKLGKRCRMLGESGGKNTNLKNIIRQYHKETRDDKGVELNTKATQAA